MHMYESYGHAMWMSYNIFSENDLLITVTPNDPGITFDPITQIEGLKLINMYECYDPAMYHGRVRAFLVKMTF